MKQLLPLLLLLTTMPPTALAADDRLEQSCRRKLTAKFTEWRFPDISNEVLQFARQNKENPTAAYGDFNDDGKQDVALLIEPHPDIPWAIAVCFASDAQLHIVNDVGCHDGITRMKKGRRYYNYAADKEGTYPRDGVHAYCFEKAGVTYLFSDGKFFGIQDSD